MPSSNIERKLAAIMFTDIAGYTESMSKSESKSLDTLEKKRSILKPLLKEYKGNIPINREELEGLPGVGRKTANVVLNEGFGHATIAVDTHVFRVSNRTGLAIGKNVMNTEKELLRVTPKKWAKNAHRYLILHGRYICKARNFDCKQCVINKECEYPEKT